MIINSVIHQSVSTVNLATGVSNGYRSIVQQGTVDKLDSLLQLRPNNQEQSCPRKQAHEHQMIFTDKCSHSSEWYARYNYTTQKVR